MTEKSENFDRELKALIIQSSEILSLRYGVSQTMGKTRKEKSCLDRFESIYNKVENPSEFYIYFKKLYLKKRNLILKSLDNDSWLRNGNITLQFGEYCEELQGKCDNIKILLSNIYNCALELKESSQNTFGDLSEELSSQDKNIIRPSIILLHLMRIFYILSDNEDDTLALSIIVNTIEEDLNVKNKTVKPIVNPFNNMSANPDILSDTLNTVFSMISNVAKSAGIEGMENLQAPSGQQIKEGLDSTINNVNIQSGINNLLKAVNNKEDMVASVTNFLQEMLKPELIESVQNALVKTAEIAKDNTLKV